jgi:crotonobetainyl-CoA:carnitine CoA-transferase CaiB-like acyl-CoA transferase
METPLKGLKVLELARILAGPWIGQTLADLGRRCHQGRKPGGRRYPHLGTSLYRKRDRRPSGCRLFPRLQPGKALRHSRFHDGRGAGGGAPLAAQSDVLLENFKVGGLAKYGLDYESLKAVNPRLIYCSVTGFGQDGPYAHRAGYDYIIQGMSGIMDLTGDPEGEPQKIGVAFADIFTGLYGVIAIQAALHMRERTGVGQQVDMALFDSMTGVLANQALNFLVSGQSPRRLGNAHPNIAPYQVFPVSDGHLIVAVGNDRQFVKFCTLLGLDSLATDPRYLTNSGRVKHRDTLTPELMARTVNFNRDTLLAMLEAAGVPGGPINTVADVFSDPQIIHRGMRVDTPHTGAASGTAPGVRTPIQFSDAELALERGAPRLGEHTHEVLAEIGMKP